MKFVDLYPIVADRWCGKLICCVHVRRGRCCVIVIVAHRNTKSFNALSCRYSRQCARGHESIALSAVIFMPNFNPAMSARDLAAIGDGRASKDIRDEQRRSCADAARTSSLDRSGGVGFLHVKGLSLDRALREGLRRRSSRKRYCWGLGGKKGDHHDIVVSKEDREGRTLRHCGRFHHED